MDQDDIDQFDGVSNKRPASHRFREYISTVIHTSDPFKSHPSLLDTPPRIVISDVDVSGPAHALRVSVTNHHRRCIIAISCSNC